MTNNLLILDEFVNLGPIFKNCAISFDYWFDADEPVLSGIDEEIDSIAVSVELFVIDKCTLQYIELDDTELLKLKNTIRVQSDKINGYILLPREVSKDISDKYMIGFRPRGFKMSKCKNHEPRKQFVREVVEIPESKFNNLMFMFYPHFTHVAR